MQENKSLGDKFAGFTSEPNPQVWENIERSLDERSPRRRFFAWWQVVLAFGVFAGILIWNFQGETKSCHTKYISKKNTYKPTEHKSSKNSAIENKSFLHTPSTSQAQTAFNSLVAADNARKSNGGTSSLPGDPPSLSNFEQPAGISGLTTGSDGVEGLMNGSMALSNPDVQASSDVLAENNAPQTDSLHSENPADSTTFSNQETDQKMKTEPKIRRWQLQFQLGALASGKQEILVSSTNDPSYEGTVNLGNGGFLPISPGNSPELKYYRNITSNYGILVSCNLSNRWRLTTGLSYLRYYTHFLGERTLNAGAHHVQVPATVDFKLIGTPRWEWSVGTGASLGYVYEKKSAIDFSSWRSDFIAQASVRFSLNERLSLQLQPQARFVFWDKQIGKIDKLSPWYWGGNLGAVWSF